MAFCNKCGSQLPEGAGFCNQCGAGVAATEAAPTDVFSAPPQPEYQSPFPLPAQQQSYQQPYQQPQQGGYYYQAPPVNDVPDTGLNVLSFFIFWVGVIIYATSHDKTPIKAKAALKSAIIGMVVWVAVGILIGVLAVVIPLLMYL